MNKKFNKMKSISQINFSKNSRVLFAELLGSVVNNTERITTRKKKHNQHIVSVESVHNNDY